MKTIQIKILMGYGVLALLSLTLILAIFSWSDRIKTNVAHMNDVVLPMQRNAGGLKAAVGELESKLYAYYATSIDSSEFDTHFSARLKAALEYSSQLEENKSLKPLLEDFKAHGSSLRNALSVNDWDGAREVLSRAGSTQSELHERLQRIVAKANAEAAKDTEGVYQEVKVMLIGAGTFLLLVVAVTAGVAIYVQRGIVTPINKLADFAHSIVDRSDLTQKATVYSDDEIGQTTRAFNTMVERIRLVVETCSQASTAVTGAVTHLNAQLSSANQSSSLQLNNTQAIKESVLNLQNQLGEVASTTDIAATKTADVSNDAMQGRELLDSTVNKIKSLSSNVANAAQIITELEQQTESIAGLTETIKEIADQTNLLALNAAIEAARAGEAGRGFAVVADEVRGLSQKTQSATLQIDSTISEVVANVHSVVSTMNSNSEQAADCAAASQQTEARLKSIMDVILDVRNDSNKIADATNRGHELSESIGQQVIELAELAGSISQGMGAATEQNNAVQNSSLALRQAADQFKY